MSRIESLLVYSCLYFPRFTRCHLKPDSGRQCWTSRFQLLDDDDLEVSSDSELEVHNDITQ